MQRYNLFLFSVLALMLFGLAMLSTASAVLAYQHTQDSYFYLKRQLLNGIIPGLFFFFIASRIPYKRYKPFALPLMLACVVLLVLLFLPRFGLMAHGATRWLTVGSFSFQPSEALKLAFIIYLAALFESRREKMAHVTQGLLPFVMVMGAVSALLVRQPDIGTLGVILLTALCVYFAAGARITHLALIVFGGLFALFIFVYGFGYEFDRIQVYLNPHSDAQGAGYQINRAAAAIGAGGAFGLGFGQSQRKFGGYLPEPMGDSIFAIIAEELGFAGIAAALALFVVLGWQGFSIARDAPDMFGGLIAAGVTSWILIQAFVNIGAISGLLPLTGIPLPFVSYGGTSLVVLFAACGIVYNIQRSTYNT
ncbi:putative lipid II flippase FtsW [Candidatus Azambacteria bacterium]|nr:putative lipid II flippase FtsW [Candidatus Azambacteria bacterium]